MKSVFYYTGKIGGTIMKRNEFMYAFCVTRTAVFEVRYYTLGGNSHPYFATSAAVFNRPKTDYNRCGQCQNDVLFGKAKQFYKKWDSCHCKDITDDQYTEMLNDIEELKKIYPNYIEYISENPFKGNSSIPFDKIKAMSMTVKR